jgi:hypothetical protein
MTAEEIAVMRADLVAAKLCLDGPCTIDSRSTPETTDDTILDGSKFFAGVDLRPIIPDFEGDTPVGFLPDPSFGGIIVQLRGIAPSLLNEDLDGDGTADILEFIHSDSYIIYGGLSFLTFPDVSGFDLLGIAKSSDGTVDFNGSYPFYMVSNTLNLLSGEYSEPEFDTFQFLPSGDYCCDGVWMTINFFGEANVSGPPDGVGGCLGCHAAFGLAGAPQGSNAIRVFGLP